MKKLKFSRNWNTEKCGIGWGDTATNPMSNRFGSDKRHNITHKATNPRRDEPCTAAIPYKRQTSKGDKPPIRDITHKSTNPLQETNPTRRHIPVRDEPYTSDELCRPTP